MSGGDSGEPIPKDSCAEEEREALILLQVDDVVVNEVKGQKREKLDQGTLTALKIAATEEELKELGCQVATEFSQENSEVVFVIISDHKIPIIRNVPIIRKVCLDAFISRFPFPPLFPVSANLTPFALLWIL